MATEPVLAFATRSADPVPLEIRVNFGVFAGREATQAELEELGRELLGVVGRVSLVSERRYELGMDAEAALHQVRIEVAADELPRSEDERAALERRLVETAGRWADACIADRHAEVSEL